MIPSIPEEHGGARDWRISAPALVATVSGNTPRMDRSEYRAKIAAGKNPHPAKRPWFPLSFDIYTETLPSAVARYPYGVDILIWHKAPPLYGVPVNRADGKR